MIAFIYLFLLPLAVATLEYPKQSIWEYPKQPLWEIVHGYEVDKSILYETFEDEYRFWLQFIPPFSNQNVELVKDINFVLLFEPHVSYATNAIISDNINGLSWQFIQPANGNGKTQANGAVLKDTLEFPDGGFQIPRNDKMIAIIDTEKNRVVLRNPLYRGMFPSLWDRKEPLAANQKSIDDEGSGSQSSDASEQ